MEKARQHTSVNPRARGLAVQMAALVAVLAVPGSLRANADPMVLPSGVQARLHEVMIDDDAPLVRLRFVVPDLADPAGVHATDPEAVFMDMQWLCTAHAPALRTEHGAEWHTVIVTLMAAPVEFGVTAPETVQVFDAFALTADRCDWEGL